MKKFLFLIIAALLLNSSHAQIRYNTGNTYLPAFEVDVRGDSCECYHMFYLIYKKDSAGILNLMNEGFDINCTQILTHYHKRNRFLRPAEETYEYMDITPVHFAILSNELNIVKLLYKKGDRVHNNVLLYSGPAKTEITGRRNLIEYAENHDIDSTLSLYLNSNGLLSVKQRSDFNWRLRNIISDFREQPDVMYSLFLSWVKEVDSSYLFIDQGLLHDALDNNIPFIYEYLIDYQEYDITADHNWTYYSSGRRRGLFRSPGSSTEYTEKAYIQVIYSDYPTIELVEYCQRAGLITEEHLRELVNSPKWSFDRDRMSKGKLFLQYYLYYFELKDASLSNKKKEQLNKRMEKIRKKLDRANGVTCLLEGK